jgi:Rieske Fe-S protein
MERRRFIHHCGILGITCMGFAIFSNACSSTKHITKAANNNQIQLSTADFFVIKNGKEKLLRYIVVNTNIFRTPIIVYRLADNKYSALLMSCTHMGNELTAHGDLLICSAHGSQFNNSGYVVQGPAEVNLKSFNVVSDDKNIFITLI